ncbi:hypothetical protein PSHT_09636 [Puccinia striiformis]|uniref:Uncharacterized protein n=1 Tax=Puccinia striiformis TaxID=27350 RepID=A0A2S4VFL7_9BASI|nr:hypothetical protein PSHT_09636 [Puccinia striiformis]
MDPEVDRLQELIEVTETVPAALERFLDSILSPCSPRGISRPAAMLHHHLDKLVQILRQHFISLNVNKNPAIDPVQIDNASRWLEFWVSQLRYVKRRMERATDRVIDWSYEPKDSDDSAISSDTAMEESEEESEKKRRRRRRRGGGGGRREKKKRKEKKVKMKFIGAFKNRWESGRG